MSSSTPVDMEISDGSDTNSDMDVSDNDQEVEPMTSYPSSSSAIPFTKRPAMASSSYVTTGAELDPRSYNPYTSQGIITKQTPMNSYYPGHDAVPAPVVGIPSYDYNNGYGVQSPYMEPPHHAIHFNPHAAPQTGLSGFGGTFEPVAEPQADSSSMNISNPDLAEDTLSESGYYTAPTSPSSDMDDEEPGLIKSEDDELEGLKAQLEHYQQQITGYDKEIEDITKDKQRLEQEFLRLRVQHSLVQNRKKAKESTKATAAKKDLSPPKPPAPHPTNSPSTQTQKQQIPAPVPIQSPASGPMGTLSPAPPPTTNAKRTPAPKTSPPQLPNTPTKPPITLPLLHGRHVWTSPHIAKKPPAPVSKTSLPGPRTQGLAGPASAGSSLLKPNAGGVQMDKKLIAPNIPSAKNQQQPKQSSKQQNYQIQRGIETSRSPDSVGVPPPPSNQPKKTSLASKKNTFQPYVSPLVRLGITTGRPDKRQQRPAIPTENLMREMCRFEMAGTCNDDTCTALHFRDFEGTMSQ